MLRFCYKIQENAAAYDAIKTAIFYGLRISFNALTAIFKSLALSRSANTQHFSPD
jgi:hypothetical protein